MPHVHKCVNPIPVMQADALVIMTGGSPPVSGTKYEWSTDGTVANALGTQKNVRIIEVGVKCVWTVQPTPLECHITLDGQLQTFAFTNPVSNMTYVPQIWGDATRTEVQQYLELDFKDKRSFLFEGRAVKIEVEITGGTVQSLIMRVKWARWTDI